MWRQVATAGNKSSRRRANLRVIFLAVARVGAQVVVSLHLWRTLGEDRLDVVCNLFTGTVIPSVRNDWSYCNVLATGQW